MAFDLKITFNGCVVFGFGDAFRRRWSRPEVSPLQFRHRLPEYLDEYFGLREVLYDDSAASLVKEASPASNLREDRSPEAHPRPFTRLPAGPGRSFRFFVSPHLKILLPVGC